MFNILQTNKKEKEITKNVIELGCAQAA